MTSTTHTKRNPSALPFWNDEQFEYVAHAECADCPVHEIGVHAHPDIAQQEADRRFAEAHA